jgi:HK97 family phage prohead protease
MTDNEKMVLRGYAAVFNVPTALWVDLDGNAIYEMISPRAFEGCDMSNVHLLYNHSSEVFSVAGTSNGSLTVTPDQYGLRIRAELVNTTAGRDLFRMVQTGLLSKMSFAFTVASERYDKATRTRVIERFSRLYDVSAVTHPAYKQTSIYAEGSSSEEVELLRQKIKMKAMR